MYQFQILTLMTGFVVQGTFKKCLSQYAICVYGCESNQLTNLRKKKEKVTADFPDTSVSVIQYINMSMASCLI